MHETTEVSFPSIQFSSTIFNVHNFFVFVSEKTSIAKIQIWRKDDFRKILLEKLKFLADAQQKCSNYNWIGMKKTNEDRKIVFNSKNQVQEVEVER